MVCVEYDEPDIEIRAAYHSGRHTQRQLGMGSTEELITPPFGTVVESLQPSLRACEGRHQP